MGGRLSSDQSPEIRRILSAIGDLSDWRENKRLAHPPGFLWWDDALSHYGGRFSGWKCCSVCGPQEKGPEAVCLVMDHCHQTGLYRGLLCDHCNLSEGRFIHSWWFLWRICAPNLRVGRRVVHQKERNTLRLMEAGLYEAPMTRLLRCCNQFNIQDKRLTELIYI